MAKAIHKLSYSGRAEKSIEWDSLLQIFDAIWGTEARSLPVYPKVIGGIQATWQDDAGVEHKAESLDEVGQAYQQYETAFISFSGVLENGPRCQFMYWPAKAEASISIRGEDQKLAEQIVVTIRKNFPLDTKYLFISYDTSEYHLATFIAKIFEKRLAPGISVFIAKRDIVPGENPLKVMLEEQLLHAEALVALCSQKSKTSPWLWWEASAVWARSHLVVPLFINVSPSKFGGPIVQVCQGRSFFDSADINSALKTIVDKVCPGNQCEELTSQEIDELNKLKLLISKECT
jgi:hypothetical protein